METKTYVIAFDSTSGAMAALQAFDDRKIRHRTIPLPAAISAGCGLAALVETDDIAPILKVARESEESNALASLYLQKSKTEYVKQDL